MEITFEIPDDILQTNVKEAVMRQLNALILRLAETRVLELRKSLDPMVEEFIKIHLPDEKLKGMINEAALEVIKDRLDRL